MQTANNQVEYQITNLLPEPRFLASLLMSARDELPVVAEITKLVRPLHHPVMDRKTAARNRRLPKTHPEKLIDHCEQPPYEQRFTATLTINAIGLLNDPDDDSPYNLLGHEPCRLYGHVLYAAFSDPLIATPEFIPPMQPLPQHLAIGIDYQPAQNHGILFPNHTGTVTCYSNNWELSLTTILRPHGAMVVYERSQWHTAESEQE